MATRAGLIEGQLPSPADPAPARGSVLADDAILPLLEGARARGVADAFEMIGQGAILLDATGAVLHAGTAATRLFGEGLSIRSGQLVGRTAAANQAIQDLIATVIHARGAGEATVEGQETLKIRDSPSAIRRAHPTSCWRPCCWSRKRPSEGDAAERMVECPHPLSIPALFHTH